MFATELKNNSCKIAKWAVSAALAGSSYIKFGYVHNFIVVIADVSITDSCTRLAILSTHMQLSRVLLGAYMYW